MDRLICRNWTEGVLLKPGIQGDGYAYEWSDSSTDSLLRVFTKGVYWVKVKYTYDNGCLIHVDTITLRGEDLIPPVINVNVYELGTAEQYSSYQWLINDTIIIEATQSTYTVSENADYRVIVSNAGNEEWADTSDIYKVTNVVGFSNHQELESQISIYPNHAMEIVYIQSSIPVQLSLTSIDGKIVK